MKGYPKSKFDIINNSQITEIPLEAVQDPAPLYMALYTSDKGEEDWEVLTDFSEFTKTHGGLNFDRHGQAQLNVIESLRSGAHVLAKRLVASNAKLANNTVMAKVVHVADNTYVYLHTKSTQDVTEEEAVFEDVIKDFSFDKEPEDLTISIANPTDPGIVAFDLDDETDTSGTTTDGETTGDENTEGGTTDDGTVTEGGNDDQKEDPVIPPVQDNSTIYNATVIDIPLFSITAVGRGSSNITFRLIPEYLASKSNSYLKYSLEINEDSTNLDNIVCSLNPDVIYDGVNQALDNKASTSKHIKAKLYYDGIYKLAVELAKTAKDYNNNPISAEDLLNMDLINAMDRRGKNVINGVITQSQTNLSNSDELWNQFLPYALNGETVINLQSDIGINLPNGDYGDLGFDPSKNSKMVEDLMLGALGAKTVDHPQFDPAIYDLDNYKVDAAFDCDLPVSVKNAWINLFEFRGDATFFADLGTNSLTTLSSILDAKNGDGTTTNPGIIDSKFVAIYHNYFKITSPYDGKQIQVTMPYLLISRLSNHYKGGVGRPFAGMANQITFPEIISKSVNFLPVTIPGVDQKQELVDNNINYISYYDGLAVMETMYTNDSEYSKLSFVHNILSIQQVIKALRSRCPKTRYTFIDGEDLEKYIDDCELVLNEYQSYFKSISMTYMQDERYEDNNIFYAAIKVTFKNFIQEEYFKVIALS